MTGGEKLPTLGLLSIADGRLMGDINTVCEVVSMFIDRRAYGHELPRYGRRAAPHIVAAFPDMAPRPDMDWQEFRDEIVAKYGDAVDVPSEWRGIAADGRGGLGNLFSITGGA